MPPVAGTRSAGRDAFLFGLRTSTSEFAESAACFFSVFFPFLVFLLGIFFALLPVAGEARAGRFRDLDLLRGMLDACVEKLGAQTLSLDCGSGTNPLRITRPQTPGP